MLYIFYVFNCFTYMQVLWQNILEGRCIFIQATIQPFIQTSRDMSWLETSLEKLPGKLLCASDVGKVCLLSRLWPCSFYYCFLIKFPFSDIWIKYCLDKDMVKRYVTKWLHAWKNKIKGWMQHTSLICLIVASYFSFFLLFLIC